MRADGRRPAPARPHAPCWRRGRGDFAAAEQGRIDRFEQRPPRRARRPATCGRGRAPRPACRPAGTACRRAAARGRAGTRWSYTRTMCGWSSWASVWASAPRRADTFRATSRCMPSWRARNTLANCPSPEQGEQVELVEPVAGLGLVRRPAIANRDVDRVEAVPPRSRASSAARLGEPLVVVARGDGLARPACAGGSPRTRGRTAGRSVGQLGELGEVRPPAAGRGRGRGAVRGRT